MQKVGYSYNVEERRIVDPLGLSVTIKAQNMEEGVLSYKLRTVPELRDQLDLLFSLKKELKDQTIVKFHDSYESRDSQSLT